MYIETSSTSTNDTALLMMNGPTSSNGKLRCLQFWYHMYGAHVNTLSVHVKPENKKMLPPLWKKTGTQGNRWQYAQVQINTTASLSYRVSNLCVRLSVKRERMRISLF